MTAIASPPQYGIKHNHSLGNVADYLAAKLADGSRVSVVSVVSVYFAIYAYEALSNELDGIESLRFIQSLEPDKTDKKAVKIEAEDLELAKRLQQKEVARSCADWIASKVDIRSIRESNLLHAKLYHIDGGSPLEPKAEWDAALNQLQLLKDVVMNPYSDATAPNIPKQEVVDAADAVDEFLRLVRRK